jgi:hypothetical protein
LGLESFRFQLEHDKCTNLIKHHHKEEEVEMDEERPMGLESSSIVECSNSQCARAKDQQDKLIQSSSMEHKICVRSNVGMV